jgi:hypothetical protein
LTLILDFALDREGHDFSRVESIPKCSRLQPLREALSTPVVISNWATSPVRNLLLFADGPSLRILARVGISTADPEISTPFADARNQIVCRGVPDILGRTESHPFAKPRKAWATAAEVS